MAILKNVERKIKEIEGFAVNFKYPAGGDVRGDKRDLPHYPYKRMASNDMTVSEWKRTRFSRLFPGYEVEVLNGSGECVVGHTKLITVRNSYCDDDEVS